MSNADACPMLGSGTLLRAHHRVIAIESPVAFENCGGRPDAERERLHGQHGEAGILAQHPPGVATLVFSPAHLKKGRTTKRPECLSPQADC
jgi:hypothetical protein